MYLLFGIISNFIKFPFFLLTDNILSQTTAVILKIICNYEWQLWILTVSMVRLPLNRIMKILPSRQNITYGPIRHTMIFSVSTSKLLFICISSVNLIMSCFIVGFVGFLCVILLWPGFFILHYSKIETFQWPNGKQWLFICINGLIGTVLSEFLWLW